VDVNRAACGRLDLYCSPDRGETGAQSHDPPERCNADCGGAPKGLAAAVLASIPMQRGVPGGEAIQNVVYAIILFTIVLTALLVFLQDRTPVGRLYSALFGGFQAGAQAELKTIPPRGRSS